MAKLTENLNISLSVNLELNHAEVIALTQLASIPTDDFFKFIHRWHSSDEQGVKSGYESLFKSINQELPAMKKLLNDVMLVATKQAEAKRHNSL